MAAEATDEKIELSAVYTRDRRIKITDQNGREFDTVIDSMSTRNDRVALTQVEVEMADYMHWSQVQPRVILTLSIPLDIEP